MKDEPNTPFETVGDGPLEARIVAAVLGEASAFEIAEVERLCRERPELLVFQQRIRALHGLLQESASIAGGADEAWKLPAEKRFLLDSLSATVAVAPAARSGWGRKSGIALFAVAACATIIAGVMHFRPKKYEAVATLELIPRTISPLGPAMAESAQYFGTEFEKIKSRETLEKVVENLDLATRWDMDRDAAVEVLKDSIKTKNVRGTDLIQLKVRHPNKQDSDDIAREVAYTYKENCDKLAQADQDRALAELRKAVRDQEDKVEERRKVLATIVRRKGIVYGDGGVEASQQARREDTIKRGLDAQDYADAKRDFETDQALLQQMKLKLIGEQITERMPMGSVVVHDVPRPRESAEQSASKAIASNTAETPLYARAPAPSAPSLTETPLPELADAVSGGLRRVEDLDSAPAPAEPAARVVAANEAAPDKIPVPGVSEVQPSLEFGDRADFGGGFDAGGTPPQAGEGKIAAKLKGQAEGKSEAVDPFASDEPAVGQALLRRASAEELRKVGKNDEARELLEKEIEADPQNEAAMDALASLDDPIRTNPAMTFDRMNLGERSRLAAKGKKAEYDLKASDASGYLFRGMDLGNDGALIPDDAEALAMAIRNQEAKVEERRKVLSTIVRTKGIRYEGDESFYRDADQGSASALQTYERLEQEKLQLESQIESLLRYDADELMVYASGINLPDNTLRTLYPKYLEAKRQLDTERTKGAGDKHPSVLAKAEELAAMKRQLDEGVVGLRATLKAQLDLTSERLGKVRDMKDDARQNAMKRGLDAQDYLEAKKDFEKDQELLEQMKLKLLRAKLEQPAFDFSLETLASEDPYSTFSLHISDASFRLAKAALDKGEQPDPASIKVEQFYNAVDYGDPAPAANEPVAGFIEQTAHPVIPGRQLVRVAVKTSAAGRSAAQPLRLTLLVDASGSMVRDDRRSAMETAMEKIAGLLGPADRVNVISFARTPRLLAQDLPGDQAGKLTELVNTAASEGGTNLEESIQLASSIAIRSKLDGAQNRIVLFTDGAANLGNADPARLAERVKNLRQQGVSFDVAGVGASELNDGLLAELARHGDGRYQIIGGGADGDAFASRLAGAFRPAAENVKVQVRFNPERVSSYRLIGFEEHRLKTEDFRNDAVDAAELAAEEAGVAIYQVQTLPEGSGEIGELSVRFRDAAVGGMVERNWTITHDPKSPALDQATPSMQLATLSMLAAEKLKGGPLAAAIRFEDLAKVRAEVKRFYGDSPKVNDMLGVIDRLR